MSLLKVSVKQIDTTAIGETVFATVSQVNAVQSNVSTANVSNAFVNANDWATFSTVTANLFNTYTNTRGSNIHHVGTITIKIHYVTIIKTSNVSTAAITIRSKEY